MQKGSSISLADYPDLTLIQTLVAFSFCGSVSATARFFGVTAGTVSQRLQHLETAMGIDLLDRSTKPAVLTRAGEQLLKASISLLVQADEMIAKVRVPALVDTGVIRLGCMDSFAGTFGPTLITELSRVSLEVRIRAGITVDLHDQLKSGQLDAIVTTSVPAQRREIRAIALFSESYLLVTPKQLSLTNVKDLASLSARLSFIRYSSASIIGHDIDCFLKAAGMYVESVYDFNYTGPVLGLVAAGMGFAITTPLCIWRSRQFVPELRILPLSEFICDRRLTKKSARDFFLFHRDDEASDFPEKAHIVVLRETQRLMSSEIAPSLGICAEKLWDPTIPA